MRTTVTLDADVAAKLRAIARERGTSFTEALNSTLRLGLTVGRGSARRYEVPTFPMRLRPGIDLDKARQLAAQLDDEEIVRKLELGR